MFSYKVYNLVHGARLLVVPNISTEAVFVSFLFDKTGSVYERPSERGIAHFLEHMMFKGTSRRPNLEISHQLDAIGAVYNAYTSKEYTTYYIKALKEKTDFILDVLFDILFHSTFDKEQIEMERKVVLEEYKMWEDDPWDNLSFILNKLVFKGHPLSLPVIGEKERIISFQRDDLLRYWRHNYSLSDLLIAVAGNTDSSQIRRKINSFLKNEAGNDHLLKPSFKKIAKMKMQNRRRIDYKYRDINQLHIGIGIPVDISRLQAEEYTRVLSVILGESSSSRLFVELREKRGICYHTSTSFIRYRYGAGMYVLVSLDKRRAKEALEIIFGQIRDICKGNISEDEIQRAKDYIKGITLMGLEDSSTLASWYASDLIRQKPLLSPHKWMKGLDRLNKDTVVYDAGKIFNPKRLNIALVGKIDKRFVKNISDYIDDIF